MYIPHQPAWWSSKDLMSEFPTVAAESVGLSLCNSAILHT